MPTAALKPCSSAAALPIASEPSPIPASWDTRSLTRKFSVRRSQSLNARPEESLYVGDVYSVDYLGATGAGMQAVLMDVPGAYRDKASRACGIAY